MKGLISLKTMATLSYDEISGEGCVQIEDRATEMHDTMLIDVLGDWIVALEEYRDMLQDRHLNVE